MTRNGCKKMEKLKKTRQPDRNDKGTRNNPVCSR